MWFPAISAGIISLCSVWRGGGASHSADAHPADVQVPPLRGEDSPSQVYENEARQLKKIHPNRNRALPIPSLSAQCGNTCPSCMKKQCCR
ncbi:hypothetical protein GJAV_G00200880 [Gymnothorax javanicus]|nr:hypothetical protein GJAV_G00200880 [Gymnothorax javanicus]